MGGKIETGLDKGGIDTALEAVARIADDAGFAAGGRRSHRVEIGALNKDIFARAGDARVLATENTPQSQHGTIVGNHAHTVVHGVRLAVEAEKGFALAAKAGTDGPSQLIGIINMQRAAAVETDVVGNIDECIDGPKAD